MRETRKNVYIWGAGNNAAWVFASIIRQKCKILGFIDSDEKKQDTEWCKGVKIYSPSVLKDAEYDYIVISPFAYNSILNSCMSDFGIPENKLIAYWNYDDKTEVIDYKYREMQKLGFEVKKYEARVANAPYEMGLETVPNVKSALELLDVIKKENCSLCRYGDGEFEMMRMRERPWFQEVNPVLSKRLTDIFHTNNAKIIIAIADNFGTLDHYTEEAADGIRQYLDGDTRQELLKIIDKERVYYDAYVTRPYFMYKDKKWAGKVFKKMKSLWDDRDVLIVEGRYGRLGVGNDLLSNARVIRRILCPEKNAFDVYEEILEKAKEIARNGELVLISLGPTATVLAYDLANEGIQALDIGQADNEYEWYVRAVPGRTNIPGKMVAEISKRDVEDIEDMEMQNEYMSQIVARIS